MEGRKMTADLLGTVGSEIDTRLKQLRPLMDEYERLLAAAAALAVGENRPAPQGTADAAANTPPRRAGRAPRAAAFKPATSTSSRRASQPRTRPYAPRGAAQQAILAALAHGSHSTNELVTVTGLARENVRTNLHRMVRKRLIARARSAGQRAYSLVPASAGK
jgi:hypothetical protein